MTNQIADRIVHFRAEGKTPCALPLSELLIELENDGADAALLDGIAHSVAWHGFYCGRHRGKTLAVFQPVGAAEAPGHLLVLVRDGAVRAMIADQALETTVIDYDNARAQIGVELPEHVGADEFQRIRGAVMNDFLAEDAFASADEGGSAERRVWH